MGCWTLYYEGPDREKEDPPSPPATRSHGPLPVPQCHCLPSDYNTLRPGSHLASSICCSSFAHWNRYILVSLRVDA